MASTLARATCLSPKWACADVKYSTETQNCLQPLVRRIAGSVVGIARFLDSTHWFFSRTGTNTPLVDRTRKNDAPKPPRITVIVTLLSSLDERGAIIGAECPLLLLCTLLL